MLTRYDLMSGRELKAEATRRFGSSKGKKLPINRNQSGYKYRLLLTQDDLRLGVSPYLPSEVAEKLAETDKIEPSAAREVVELSTL